MIKKGKKTAYPAFVMFNVKSYTDFCVVFKRIIWNGFLNPGNGI